MADVPVRPAAYISDRYDPGLGDSHGMLTGLVQDWGWPTPTVYADDDQPGSQLAALIEAISADRHDALCALHPELIGRDLDQIEAFYRLCRQHGVRVRYWWAQGNDLRGLFQVIRRIKRFTVTDEHLRLLRRANVNWDVGEYPPIESVSGAPGLDPKRPYGNSGAAGDIAKILEVPDSDWLDADEDLNPDAEWRFMRVHVETGLALQIALVTGEFRAGRYMRENDSDYSDWRRDEA